jgi:uncharacterized membrane protein YeaQ/YmgE (transglycosylase-associated protein family)
VLSYIKSGCSGDYLTKAPSNPGAGDVLMGFLGSVIISFAFSMFKQRKVPLNTAVHFVTSFLLSSILLQMSDV